MRKWILVGVAALAWVGAARAEMKLFAKYDWKDGAKDVAGAAIRHDGILDPEASIVGGKLVVSGWDGVKLGKVPELDGATEVMFRFEDVTFEYSTDSMSGGMAGYPVLVGDGMKWWVAADFSTRAPEEGRTTRLVFYLGGYGFGSAFEAPVPGGVVTHFDSIEYRVNGAAPVEERFGIRWNDGPWMVGGIPLSEPEPQVFPVTEEVRINNGGPADWDPLWGSLGSVSMYSDVVVPEPGAMGAVGVVVLLGVRRRR